MTLALKIKYDFHLKAKLQYLTSLELLHKTILKCVTLRRKELSQLMALLLLPFSL